MHICVGNLTIIGPDNGLSPGRRQAIIWTNAEILLIGLWATNFSEILISIQAFSFKKMHLKMSSAKWRPFCLGLNVLTLEVSVIHICMISVFGHHCPCCCLITEQCQVMFSLKKKSVSVISNNLFIDLITASQMAKISGHICVSHQGLLIYLISLCLEVSGLDFVGRLSGMHYCWSRGHEFETDLWGLCPLSMLWITSPGEWSLPSGTRSSIPTLLINIHCIVPILNNHDFINTAFFVNVRKWNKMPQLLKS